VEKLLADGYLNKQAKAALFEAFRIDRRVELGKRAPGVGGFLISFLADAQGEVNKSNGVSDQLDRSTDTVLDERTDNGASSEIVGTHTLLSKDTPRSQPLYEDARALAKYASLAVATRMLTEVATNSDISAGLDWAQILRTYLRFPSAGPNMWETQVLADYRQNGRDPTYGDIADRPEFKRLNLADADRRLSECGNGTARARLAKLYTDLERIVDT
jgi:hypothetical protein